MCFESGCPDLVPPGGDCEAGHTAARRRAREARRPTARQRGYDVEHERRFRRQVLARDPVCVKCGKAPSTDADHYPLSRADLVARGLDPNDPKHGRGLCHPCHSRETVRNDGGLGLRGPR